MARSLRSTLRNQVPGGGVILALSSTRFLTGTAADAMLAAIIAPADWTVSIVSGSDFGGRVKVSGRQLQAATALSAAATGTAKLRAVSADGRDAVEKTFDLAVEGATTAVLRAAGFGANATNTKDPNNSGQWSAAPVDPIYFPFALKAGDVLELGIPLWTMERNGTSTVLETDIEDAREFAVNLEYPYTKGTGRSAANVYSAAPVGPNGSGKVYSYTPGQAETEATFRITLAVDVPAMEPVGVEVIQDHIPSRVAVAGGGSGTSGKMVMRVDAASNFINRGGKGQNRTYSLIQQNNGGPITGGYTLDNGSQTGLAKPMKIGGVRMVLPAGQGSVAVWGNSIEQGSNEGTFQSGSAGDASGDQYGGRGYATRTAHKLGVSAANMSRGSDRDAYRLNGGVGANIARRLSWLKWLNTPVYQDMNWHNDVGPGSAVAWAASTAYSVADYRRMGGAGGRYYLCVQAGTSGTVEPTGPGADIADGTARWTYIGPDDLAGAAGGAAQVANRYKFRQMVKAAGITAKPIGATTSPDLITTTVTATSYTYDSATGLMVITLPVDVSKLSVGAYCKVNGMSAGTTNSRIQDYTTITAVDTANRTITVQRATGLTMTGTAVVHLMWIDPLYQGAAISQFEAKTSPRTWINRFTRNPPNNVLDYIAINDMGRYSEAGEALVPADETGKWAPLAEPGSSIVKGQALTPDGTHHTSVGLDYIAGRAAAETAITSPFYMTTAQAYRLAA